MRAPNKPRMMAAAIVGTLCVALTACAGGTSTPEGSASSAAGNQAKVTFKVAFNQTEGHPQYKAAVELGRLLEEETDGRYSIEVYPNDQLGGQSDVIQNVSDGSVEMMWIGGALMESVNPDFAVFNLPYVFETPEAQEAVLSDEELVGELFGSLEESKQITVLAGVFAGVRNIYNIKGPIRTPDDLAGLKIRVQQSDTQVRMIELMGGIPTPMAFGEIYSALQTGVLEGAENNETVYNAIKHDEVAKYYSYTRHLIIPDYLLMSTKVLNDMSDADRETFLELIPKARAVANDFDSFTQESIAASKAAGAQFNDDVDVAAFRERVKPLQESEVSKNEVRQALYAGVQEANKEHPAK